MNSNKMIEFFDSNSHYNNEQYDVDRDELIEKMYNEGITKIIIAGSSVETTKTAIELADKYKHIYATAGIHPQDIENITEDISEIEKLSMHQKVVAIGEIGLDYHYTKDNKEEQKQAFIKQIKLANKVQLPIVIHCRDAYVDTIDILKNIICPSKKGIFHCCQLNMELIKDALNLGFNISFAGPVTFKNSKNVKECLDLIPLERLHIETDAPYLSPEPLRGTRNNSINMKITAQKIADYKEISLEKLANITYENALKMFEKIKS